MTSNDLFYLLPDEPVEIKDSLFKLTKKIYVAGRPIDNKILDFISNSNFNFGRIKSIVILVPYTNLNSDFETSWTALERDLNDYNIELRLLSPTIPIYSDVFFFDEFSYPFFIYYPLEKPAEWEIRRSLNPIIKNKILQSVSISEDFSTIRGREVYSKKYIAMFQIDERNFSHALQKEILMALYEWENHSYRNTKSLLDIFEYLMRHFLIFRIKPNNRDHWFSQNIIPCFNDPDIQQGIMTRIRRNRYNVTDIDKLPFPVEYLVCENYPQIINHQSNRQYFQDYRDKNSLKIKIFVDDIIRARNPQFHNRSRDLGIDVEITTIIKTLEVLDWLVSIETRLNSLVFIPGEYDPIVNTL